MANHTIVSPLETWPGEIHLPHPDEFSGLHWQAWKDGVNRPKRKSYANLHLYAYGGLELVKAHGDWQMEIPIEEVQAWENTPEDERTKLVAWIGRSMMLYMDSIMDPKG